MTTIHQQRTDLVAQLAALTVNMQGYPSALSAANAAGDLGAYGTILQAILIAPITSLTIQVELARIEALLSMKAGKLDGSKKEALILSFMGARDRALAELGTGTPVLNGTQAAIEECIGALDAAISSFEGTV